MLLTPRASQMIRILLEHEDGISDQDLAELLNLSKRTVQRELKDLELDLKAYHVTIARKYGSGIQLSGSLEDLEHLRAEVAERKQIDFTDKQERRKYLLFELLRDRDPHKLYYFSEMMGVSEATISHDLEKIEPWLAENHLTAVRKPGYGVVLNGREKDYREALQRFISDNVSEERLKSIAYEKNDALAQAIRESTDVGNIYDLLNGDVIQRVAKILNEMDEPRLNQLADNAYIGLIVHISIAVQRILEGAVLKSDTPLIQLNDSSEDGMLAMRILRRLEQEFGIHIPEVERDYILLHIKGSKLRFSEDSELQEGYPASEEEILDLIDRMIDAFDPAEAYELKCDEPFIHGLLVHLQPTLVRLKNGMNICNPLLQEIKTEYPEIFEKCRKAAEVITEYTGVEVNEAEIGYLATHFGAARVHVSSRRTFTRKVMIGIVCASGFGVSRLMMTKLANKLHSANVSLQAFSHGDMASEVVKNVDFFVTSIDLKNFGVDYIMVSPLITAKDLAQVECKVEEYAHVPRQEINTNFVDQLNSMTVVSETIKGILRRYRLWQVSPDITFDQLLTSVSAHLASGPKAQEVLKADLQAREDIVTQIIPELRLILLHCRTDAVTEPCCCTVLPLAEGGFTDPGLKSVRTVLVLLMPKTSASNKLYADMLGRISAAVIDDAEFLDQLSVPDEETLRSKLSLILKSYFSEYIRTIEYGG